jgi:hypothetical protein
MEQLNTNWQQSKWFRAALITAIIWFILRLAVQIIYASGAMPELTGDDSLPMDLPVYLGAAQHFSQQQDLYPQDLSDSTYHYPYSPPFAMLSTLLLWIPERWIAIGGTLLGVIIYGLLYLTWQRIFQKWNLPHLAEKLAYTLPVWLIFSAFWGGIVYLNIGIFVALVSSLFIETILDERLKLSAMLAVFLLISKLMWAFPLALPLLLGKRKFFTRLIGAIALLYALLVTTAMAVTSPGYIFQQYQEYFIHLSRIASEFPWHIRTLSPYLGYNHSIKQTIIFILGDSAWVKILATAVKIAILLPLGMLCWKISRAKNITENREFQIGLAFALYLGAFIWLDIVWDALLAVAIFPYLLTFLAQKWEKVLAWSLFMLYALVDVIQFLSYMIGGDSVVVIEGEYVLTDPSLHLPLTMMIILLFYFFIMRQLNLTVAKTQKA